MADINNDQTSPLENKSLSDFGYTPFGGNSQSSNNAPAINAGNFNDINIDEILDSGINNNIANLAQASSKSGTNSVESKMPVMQYANASDIERFAYQDDFNGSGFNPFDPTNNERWVAKETWSSSLAKGFDSFGEKFGQTFSDYWKDYGRMTSALVTMNADELIPDAQEMMDQNYAEHISSMKNYVFIPEQDEDAIFSKRSISEFVGNAGFAMGTMAGFATELAADALITVATAGGGAASFGLTAGRLATKVGTKIGIKVGKEVVEEGAEAIAKKAAQEAAEAAAKNVSKGNFFTGVMLGDESLDVIKATDNIKKVNHMTKDRTIMREMKHAFSDVFGNITQSSLFGSKFLDKAWDITKGIPLAGTALKYGEKTVAAARAGRGFGETAGVAFKGLRRLGQEYNLAASEASFEAVTTYGSTLEKMIENHEKNSEDPLTATQLLEMKKVAGTAAFTNYESNMAILLASNKIQFGNLFNKMPGLTKFSKELLEEAPETLLVNRAFGKTLKGVMQNQVYDKTGFLGTYGLLGKISKDFGKKQALLEVGKSIGKGLLKFEVTEGVQENFQEMSSSAWSNYYANRYNGVYTTLEKAFEQGAAEQFTKQGFKTFLQGAFTGSLIRGPVHALQYGMQKTNEYAASKYYQAQGQGDVIKESKEKKIESISILNKFFQDVSDKTYDNTVLNFTNQMNSAMDATEAAAEGKDYDFVNAKDNSLIQAAISANKLNQTDALTGALKQMGANMSQEEFESAFKVKLSETKFSSPQEFINDVSDKLENYSDQVDQIRNRVKNKLVDPYAFKPNSDDFIAATITRKVQEDFINILAINTLKSQRAAERAKSVFESYNSISDLASSSDYIYRVLTNSQNLKGEIGNISANIKILEESLSIEGISKEEKEKIREQIKDNKEELDTLQEWRGFWGNRDYIVNDKGEVVDKEGKVVEPEILDVFVGVRSEREQSFKQDNGTIEKKYVYETGHRRIKDAFKKLINIKNKQAGFQTSISITNLDDGFQKVMDFTQLDSDARDYMEASEALNSPESYQATIRRMEDGRFKAHLLHLIENLNQNVEATVLEILKSQGKIVGSLNAKGGVTYTFVDFDLDEFKKIRDSINKQIKESEPFKNLLKLAITKEIGLSQREYAQEQMLELEEVLKKVLKENLKDQVPGYQFEESITDEVYNKFKEEGNPVPEDVIENIAKRIVEHGSKSLSPREKEVYNLKSARIDVRVAVLTKEEDEKNKTEAAKPTTTPTNDIADDAFGKALIAMVPTTVDGVPGYTTVYTDVDGVDNSVFGADEPSVINQLEEYRLKDLEKLNTKAESQTPPVQGTDFVGEIPSDTTEGSQEESDEKLRSEQNLALNSLMTEFNNLIMLQGEGKTTTDEGLSIVDEMQRLTTEINELSNLEVEEYRKTREASEKLKAENVVEQEVVETVSPDLPIEEVKAENAEKETSVDLAEKANEVVTTPNTIADDIEKRRDEALVLNKPQINSAGTEMVITSKSKEFKLGWFTKKEALEEINAKYDDEYLDAVEKGKMTKAEALDFLGKAGRKKSNAYEAVIQADVPNISNKPIETGKDLPVEVKDESGSVITTVNTEDDAVLLKQRMDNNLKDHVFIESVLDKLKLDPKLKQDITLIESIREQMSKAMDSYNSENKGVAFTSLESFYNSNRKTKIALNKIIKNATNADIQTEETSVPVKKVTSKTKTKQSTSDIVTETKSLDFNEAVQQLHNDLMALEGIPTTTQKTEQIAIIFPEGTTDFAKFVNTSIEEITLNKLKDIKVSCKQ